MTSLVDSPTNWRIAQFEWLIAQLAYDRIRRLLRQDGLTTDEVERRLQFAALQLMGKKFSELEADMNFALHLEQAMQGNANPHY